MKSYRQIAFDGLAHDLSWIGYYARDLTQRMPLIAMRPDYPTLVQTAMQKAEQDLLGALEAVRDARLKYDNLPIENEEAA